MLSNRCNIGDRWVSLVVKHAAQVRIAPATRDRFPAHTEGIVPEFLDVLLRKGCPEAGPPSAGLKLRLRAEKGRVTTDAAKPPLIVKIPVGAHEESVCFVYADGGAAWVSEDAPTDDGGALILRATIQGEQEAARFSAAGERGIVLRFGAFYGPTRLLHLKPFIWHVGA